MIPWWHIKYFDRKNGYKEFDSSIIQLKLLPEIVKIDLKNGHLFKTDQFQIDIPESNIMLHMPSNSIWVGKTPYSVPNAYKVILFKRTYKSNQSTYEEIYIGLLDKDNFGVIVKYNNKTKITQVENIKPELNVSANTYELSDIE